MGDPLYLIAYVLLGAVAGMIYSLRRIFKLEQTVLGMEKRILTAIVRTKTKSVLRSVKKKAKKKKVARKKVKKKPKKKAKRKKRR